MSDTTTLLSVAGVNIAEFLDDTSHLSTIRGGGLLLLDAVARVEIALEKLAQGTQTLSRGASEGLFWLPVGANAEAIRGQVEKMLNDDPQLKHATFVVDVEAMKGESDFPRAKEMVKAKNRWRQMQAPSLAIPKATGDGACEENGIRPISADGKCASVLARKKFGQDQKQGLYAKLTGLNDLPAFARDFGTIASCKTRGNLHNKLAVIYLDGNAFGGLQKAADTPDKLQTFDQDLRDKREAFLKDVLREITGQRAWMNGEVLRFETLLWGGDEMMFVVPAWQGWALLERFFAFSKKWRYDEQALHHAAGLVFCHHNAPIARIRDLAHDLADHVKDLLGDKKKEQSGLAYLTLESFDSLGTSLDSFLGQTLLRFEGNNKHPLWWLPAEAMPVWAEAAPTLFADLPKRRIHRAAQEVSKEGWYDEALVLEGLDESLKDKWAALKGAIRPETLPVTIPDDAERTGKPVASLLPLHLALLWDYLDTAED